MSFSPEVQQLIAEVEQLSGLPVHVAEEPTLNSRATASPARAGSPANWVRYRPGVATLDYLVASQLLFLIRMYACSLEERWDVITTEVEHAACIKAMGLESSPPGLANLMVGQIISQLRTYSIGMRIDRWILDHLPGLGSQQVEEIRSQLSENERSLDPEIRRKFPRPLVNTNSAMNAVFASFWAKELNEPRFNLPFVALGYRTRAEELAAVLDTVPDDPRSDRKLIEGWAGVLGLSDSIRFRLHSFS